MVAVAVVHGLHEQAAAVGVPLRAARWHDGEQLMDLNAAGSK